MTAGYRIVMDVADTVPMFGASPRRRAEALGVAVMDALRGVVPIVGLSVGKAAPGTSAASAAQISPVRFDPVTGEIT